MTVGDYIADARKRISLSQGRLAAMAGVSQSTISDIEKGTRDVSLSNFIAICSALSLVPSDVLSEILSGNSQDKPFVPSSRSFVVNDLSNQEISILNSLVSLLPSQQNVNTTAKGWVHGVAAAGDPVYFVDYDEKDAITINPKYVDNDRFTVIRVKGDSMDPVIKDGDHVVVQRFMNPFKGDICLAHISVSNGDEEYVIKKYFPLKNKVRFLSVNPDYAPLIINDENILSIEKVVDIISGV